MHHRPLIVLTIATTLLLARSLSQAAQQPGGDNGLWQQYATPEEAGFSSDKLAEAREHAKSIESAAVMVIYRGQVVAAWGDVERRFRCHSVRKSFLSSLYGIHVEEGNIDMSKTLADLKIDDKDPLTTAEKQARIVDLIRARSGVYHPAAKEPQNMSANRPERGSHAPGTYHWYNNWDFNTLCTIFEQETGTKIFEEFKKRMADPLGMEDFRFRDTLYELEPSKSIHEAYAFRMSARDMGRFGLLFAQTGIWNGQQIVPSGWVKENTSIHSDLGRGRGYGYMWWVWPAQSVSSYPTVDRYDKFSATGTGGQFILVIPEAEIVFVHRGDTDNNRRVRGPGIWKLVDQCLAAKTGEAKPDPAYKKLTAIPFANALPAPEERTEIPLDPKVSDAYLGHYELAPEVHARIFKVQNRLFASVSGSGEGELFPESETKFFVKTANVQIEFVKSAVGVVTHMVIYEPGAITQARKLE